MRELHVEVCAAWKGVWSPLRDNSSAIWIPGRDGDRAAYSRWWCHLFVVTPPLCSRCELQTRTPGSSFGFSSSLIFFLTTRGALRPYQAWQARAYMTAASSSVKCMVSTEKSSGLRSPPCLPTDRHVRTGANSAATTMHQPWPPAFADYLTRKHYWLHPSRMGGEAHLKVELDASTGFPGRASAPWVRAKVHTGVTRGSIQFIAPFREPEKNPVVDLALSRANTADWLCARRFPGDCASMTPRFISCSAILAPAHLSPLSSRWRSLSAGPPDRAISYGRTSEPAS